MLISDPVGPTPLASKAARRRRTGQIALLGSALLHAAALLAVFSSASGELVSGAAGGGAEGPVFEVMLVGPSSTAAANSSSQSELQPMFAKFKVAPAPNAVPMGTKTGGNFASMVERFKRETPTQQATQRDGDQEERSPKFDAEAPSLNDSAGARAKDAVKGPSPGAPTAGSGLWKRIEPCWRDIGGSVRVPVSLEITLDGSGRLAKPPTILRPASGRADEARLAAESTALSALAACLPKNDVTFGGRTHRLDFPGH